MPPLCGSGVRFGQLPEVGTPGYHLPPLRGSGIATDKCAPDPLPLTQLDNRRQKTLFGDAVARPKVAFRAVRMRPRERFLIN